MLQSHEISQNPSWIIQKVENAWTRVTLAYFSRQLGLSRTWNFAGRSEKDRAFQNWNQFFVCISAFFTKNQKLWLISWNLLNDPKCFFRHLSIFCKKLVNTNEKRMILLKSPVFFWSPCKISCLGKVRFIQNWGLIDPDWRVFCDFWPFWMNHHSKSTWLTKMIFWILKEILEDYLPWKFEPQSCKGSWNKAASVF